MFTRCCALLFALVLAVSFSTVVLAQDAVKKGKDMKDKGMEMGKDMGKDMGKEMKMGPLKSFMCDAKCGFMMKSHDEKEMMKAVKNHMKYHHADMKMSDDALKGMMKVEEEHAMPGMKKD